MKEYKLISLDEYEAYMKWKDKDSVTHNEMSQKDPDTTNEIFSKTNLGNDSDGIKTENINSDNKNTTDVSSNMNDVDSSKPDNKNEVEILLPPPGIPLNNIKREIINYSQNGGQPEWIKYWRKSIR